MRLAVTSWQRTTREVKWVGSMAVWEVQTGWRFPVTYVRLGFARLVYRLTFTPWRWAVEEVEVHRAWLNNPFVIVEHDDQTMD